MWEKFSDIIAACVEESHVDLYKSSACEALSENVLQFERRSKQRNVVSLTTVRNTEGTLSTNDTETSQILCDQFQQVYAQPGICGLVQPCSNFS